MRQIPGSGLARSGDTGFPDCPVTPMCVTQFWPLPGALGVPGQWTVIRGSSVRPAEDSPQAAPAPSPQPPPFSPDFEHVLTRLRFVFQQRCVVLRFLKFPPNRKKVRAGGLLPSH